LSTRYFGHPFNLSFSINWSFFLEAFSQSDIFVILSNHCFVNPYLYECFSFLFSPNKDSIIPYWSWHKQHLNPAILLSYLRWIWAWPGWQNDLLTKWHIAKMTCWQNDLLTKWIVDKMTSWQNVQLTKWWVNKMTNWHMMS
jgi:hypothetical protein